MNNRHPSTVSRLCRLTVALLLCIPAQAQEPAADAPQAPVAATPVPVNPDREVLIDGTKLGSQVRSAFQGLTTAMKTRLPELAKRLSGIAQSPQPVSPAEVATILADLETEFAGLADRLAPASGQLAQAEDAVAAAVARIQGQLAKRAGATGTDPEPASLQGFAGHLNELGTRMLTARTQEEKERLQRLFDSAWRLFAVARRAHGKLTESERLGMTRVIGYLLRMQGDIAVAGTRANSLRLTIAHGRDLIGHFRSVLDVLAECRHITDVLRDIGDLGDLPNIEMPIAELGPIIEQLTDEAGKGLDSASGNLAPRANPTETLTLTPNERAEALRSVGVDVPAATPANGTANTNTNGGV